MKTYKSGPTNMPRTIVFLALTFLFFQEGHAEICKLVEEGQVTYTELPSCEDGEKVNVSSGGYTIEQRSGITEVEQPYKGEFPSKRLMIGEISYFEAGQSSAIGRYLFDSECVGSSPIFWPDVLDTHPIFFPDEKPIRQSIARVFTSNSYNATINNAGTNLTLSAEIREFRLEVCASDTTVNLSQMDGEFLPASKYRESAIEMLISWQVSDVNGTVLGSFETEGYFDSRNRNRGSPSHSISLQIQSTIRSAVINLLNNSTFTNLLVGDEVSAPPPPAQKEMFSLQSRILVYVIIFIVALVFLKRVLDSIS